MQPQSNILMYNESYFKSERNVAFKRGQRVLAHFAERSNEKELNAEITPLEDFYKPNSALIFSTASKRSQPKNSISRSVSTPFSHTFSTLV